MTFNQWTSKCIESWWECAKEKVGTTVALLERLGRFCSVSREINNCGKELQRGTLSWKSVWVLSYSVSVRLQCMIPLLASHIHKGLTQWLFNWVLFLDPEIPLTIILLVLVKKLFWQRLSQHSLKSVRTKSIGIMGSDSLPLPGRDSQCFAQREGSIDTLKQPMKQPLYPLTL